MIKIERLTKVFANTGDGIAGGIRDAEITLPAGGFLSLLGPSGCGKTTTLRCIAGLETPDLGSIRVGDRTLFDDAQNVSIPMNARDIGMVFQSYAIWPHMSVFENVAFPLKVARRYGKEEMKRLVSDALARVDLAGFETRSATRLSGGQQQRVALARAIVRQPKLLLLDEPLSNLDAALREEMRKELKNLQRQLGVTTVYVTHDQEEALALSDIVAVVDRGRIVQIGPPRDIYLRPASTFVARFVGAANLLAATALDAAVREATLRIKLASGDILVALASDALREGQSLVVAVRPEALRLGEGESGMRGVVESTSFLGASTRCDVACGLAHLTLVIDHRISVRIGETIAMHADPGEVIAFASDVT